MRPALLYALMDCSDVIQVEHLQAALAVWAYCEASARRIFGGGEEQGQVLGGQSHTTAPLPLHLRLLDAIAKSPGINRRGLHEAMGNRVKADDMEAALAILEAQRLAHRSLSQSEGGGRPAECWWPGPGDDPSDDDPSNDDPSDGESDDGKGVTFTMGGGGAAATASATASAYACDFAASVGRPASASPLEESEGVETVLRTEEQTPAPPPVPEIISPQSFFAGGTQRAGGATPRPHPPSQFVLSQGAAQQTRAAGRKPLVSPTPHTNHLSEPDAHAGYREHHRDRHARRRRLCPARGRIVPTQVFLRRGGENRPGDEFCPTCFEAALREALMIIADSAEKLNRPITTVSIAAPPSST